MHSKLAFPMYKNNSKPKFCDILNYLFPIIRELDISMCSQLINLEQATREKE